jgi:son of sevenless-like protein
MVKSAEVPPPFEAAFAKAETYIERLFSDFQRRPEEGTIRIGGERYVLLRAESLYLAWFDAMESTFGAEVASDFIYNTAREIGGEDARELAARLGVDAGVDSLAAGPIHFAFAGWARVEILADSRPALDDTYFLHYYHPNTFESEVLRARQRKSERPACLFSAGYSAGWCSVAFGVEVHARELRCLARGEPRCEFIMSPAPRLDDHQRETASRWTAP